MKKILVVAQSEFATLVRTKAFIISIILMPVVMVGSMVLVQATRDTTDIKDRRFAVIDQSGIVAAPLAAAARAQNASVEGPGGRVAPRFLPTDVPDPGDGLDALRLELSRKVRDNELFAFVEIPREILDPDSASQIRYYSNTPAYFALPQWLQATTSAIVQAQRFEAASVDRELIARLTRPAPVERLGLVERDSRGRVQEAREVDMARATGVPIAFLILMYITVMSSAPQLLNSVIEEKMSRISEVLIGSVTPFQLMMGKLIGSASVSAVIAVIYVLGALGVAFYWGYGDAVTPAQLGMFLFFLTMAVVLFGALFIAIGAACTDLKDSQNMMTPVILLVMLPVFLLGPVLRAPDGTLATVLSMVPTAAPFLMMARIAMQPGPPAWQIVASVVLMLVTVVIAVWAAGRIFRTGILMQGKSATVGEMIRWVRAG
jgi:ABC-2 type transport system permease protein